MIGAERQRPFVDKHQRKIIARLVKALEQSLDDAVRGAPAWREKEDLLASVPGVGPVIARTLSAELPELGQRDRKKIAALALLAPWTLQSGGWRGKTFIGGGRFLRARAALFMGALVAARTNLVRRAFKQRLIDAGKPKLGAIIAVARKLLTILNAGLRGKKPWREVEPELAHAKV